MRGLFWISLFLVGLVGVLIPVSYFWTASKLPQLETEFDLETSMRHSIEGERMSYLAGTSGDKPSVEWPRPDFSKLPKDLVALYISQSGCPTFFQTPREEGLRWGKRIFMAIAFNSESRGDGFCERRMAVDLARRIGITGNSEVNVAATKIHGFLQKDQLVAYNLESMKFERAIVGVDAASRKILKKPVNDLNLAETAEFALTLRVGGLGLWRDVKQCSNAALIRQARDSLLSQLSRDALVAPEKAKGAMAQPVACLTTH